MKSIIKTGLAFATAALLVVGSASAAKKAKNGYNTQKVVYHVNNLQSAFGALRNVKNHLNALGDKNIEVRVVTHSSGAFAMVDGTKDKKGHAFSDTIAALSNRGVKFYICANTIRGKKISKDKINLNAKVIPSGVAEVAHLQQEGFFYIKP
ncbi:hypothetical protein MNBD_GAMMA12-551 [hydrothermal vent metagenome]|uniref:Uncharacterized protein n=1 Tax=hydrothermal vent metagenome TaxID=652676 RepID=A0A3B0XXT5_9ZZZZ